MKNNAPTFVIIGKPNNGKSSMISALTFDDRIAISKEVGTTTVSASYSYRYKNEIICNFYDTPGFEQARDLWSYIEYAQDKKTYGNNILRDYIQEYSDVESKAKDIEILKAIIESDYLIFMINISEDFNEDVIGYELEVIKFIKKPTLVMFNKIGAGIEVNSENWSRALKEYGLNKVYRFNPLKSNYTNVQDVYKNILDVVDDKHEVEVLEKLLKINKQHIQENKHKSSIKIAQMLQNILQTSHESYDEKKALDEFRDKIYTIEKDTQKEIAKIWGYYQVKIVDERAEFDSVENIKLGLSRKRLTALGSLTGAGSGAVISAPSAIVDMGISTVISGAIGGIVGGVGAYILGDKYHKVLISDKKIIHKIDKKATNISIILLKRSLEYVDKLIRHGHANRTDIVISQDDEKLKFNSSWSFKNDEEKKILKIHKSIVKDEDTRQKVQELAAMIDTIIDREILV